MGRSANAKKGKRADLGDIYWKSAWECNYARFLNFLKEEWEYEPHTFWFERIKRGTRSYKPDFFVKRTNSYIEVKGWWDRRSRTQMKRMALYYPEVKILIVDKEFFASICKKGMCKLIKNWECPHNEMKEY